MGDKYDMK